MTRVLIFTTLVFPHLGGISSSISAQVKWLQEAGFNVEVLSLRILPRLGRYILLDGPALVADKILKGSGFLWTYSMRRIIFGLWLFLTRSIREWDVILTHDVCAQDCLWGITLARRFRGRAFLVANDYYAQSHVAHGQIKPKSFAERYAFNREVKVCREVSAVVAVDSRIGEYIVKQLGVPRNRVMVIMNSVDTDKFQPIEDKSACRTQFGLPQDGFIILVPRRLVPKTGVEYSIIAASKVRKLIGTNFRLVIAGTGTEETRLRTICVQNSVENVVRFLGSIPSARMMMLYGAADCVLIPSVNVYGVEEATSLAALEAMSCSLPVIASAVGGLKELIVDQVNGILVPEKDTDALAKAIMRVYQDPNLRHIIGAKARESVIKHTAEVKSALYALVSNGGH